MIPQIQFGWGLVLRACPEGLNPHPIKIEGWLILDEHFPFALFMTNHGEFDIKPKKCICIFSASQRLSNTKVFTES